MNSVALETLTLPTDYDISRIQMTRTHYRIKKFKKNDLSNKRIYLESFDFVAFKQQQEESIPYFQEKDFSRSHSVAEKILRIITCQRYRSGSSSLIQLDRYAPTFLDKLQTHIDRNEPVKMMLPAFPFKVRNPLKSSRMDADLAEVASLCKFHEINQQIKRVYSPGAQFIIFHDGHLYYRHFLHTQEDADRYFSSLKRFVKSLQIQDHVIFKDAFQELQGFEDFEETYQKARKEMENLWASGKDTVEKIQIIRQASDDNINLSDIDEEILYQIATCEDKDLASGIRKIKAEITDRANKCAFEYMVVQHALEKLRFFDRSVPSGLRLTVHPKEGQIGLYLVKKTTFLLPWMGVGVMKKSGEVSVRYEHDVNRGFKFSGVFIGQDHTPFYYLEN